MKQFFRGKYSWQSVYYHFQKWSKNGSWERVWNIILQKHKKLLDLSSIQLDGTHTPAKRGGESVAYHGRKKSKTTNTLIITGFLCYFITETLNTFIKYRILFRIA